MWFILTNPTASGWNFQSRPSFAFHFSLNAPLPVALSHKMPINYIKVWDCNKTKCGEMTFARRCTFPVSFPVLHRNPIYFSVSFIRLYRSSQLHQSMWTAPTPVKRLRYWCIFDLIQTIIPIGPVVLKEHFEVPMWGPLRLYIQSATRVPRSTVPNIRAQRV